MEPILKIQTRLLSGQVNLYTAIVTTATFYGVLTCEYMSVSVSLDGILPTQRLEQWKSLAFMGRILIAPAGQLSPFYQCYLSESRGLCSFNCAAG